MAETIYRVTWKSVDPAREEHVEDFRDIENGYDFYLRMQRDANAYKVT